MPNQKDNNKPSSSPLDAFLQQQQDDCDRPACKDTVSAISNALSRLKKEKGSNHTSLPSNTSANTSGSSTLGESVAVIKECPPSKGVIGDSTWTFLHSMAAWYPDQPTAEQQRKMTNFMDALAIFYPCSYCAEDFQENMKQSPIRAQSRKDLCVWLCEQHNKVNEKLGKKLFQCDMKSLDERWRKSSDPACNPP